MRKCNKKGFTIIEMLIVVAIIAILIGIAIPTFSGQLEKSKESVDLANVRSAISELMAAVVTEDGNAKYNGEFIRKTETFYSVSVGLQQKQKGWQGENNLVIAGTQRVDLQHWQGQPMPNGKCSISYDTETENLVINWNSSNIATNLSLQEGCWNGPATASNRQLGKMISTFNKGSSKYEGLYELEAGTTYKVSFTYNPHFNNEEQPTRGIVARAILLFDSDRRNVLDTGTGSYNLKEENILKNVKYRYVKNGDGTLTYTATLTTPTEDKNYYYGMNFGGRNISSNGSTSGDLNFTVFGPDVEKELMQQLLTSFTIEKIQ